MKTPKSPEQLKLEFKNCIDNELVNIYVEYYKLVKEEPEIRKIMVELENTPLYQATFYTYVIKVLERKVENCKLIERLTR